MTSRHPIPVRKPGFVFDASIPRFWLGGNAPATHFFNGLNLVFPDGERFFIRAVLDHLPKISDEGLRLQIQGFFGQEGRHAYEHERYFSALEAQGYRLETYLRRFHRFYRWTLRLPAPLRLAMTAGAEHYTATFGAFAIEDEELLRECHPTLRNLIVWHATEEIEHKAVAFDVLQATHPSYALRLLGFAISTLVLFSWTLTATYMLLRQDRRAGRLSRTALAEQRRALRARDVGRLPRRLWQGICAYLRPGFHPAQIDDLPLAHRRLREMGLEAAG